MLSGIDGGELALAAGGDQAQKHVGHPDSVCRKAAREAVIGTITTESPVLGPAAAAIAPRAVLPDATALTVTEQRLLEERLDRLAASCSS